jgi:hypothetical protein
MGAGSCEFTNYFKYFYQIQANLTFS